MSGDVNPQSIADFAPNVRQLTLWIVDTDFNFHTNLTQICFNSLCPSQQHIIPSATFIQLLQRSSRLQILNLSHIHLADEQATGATTVIELAFDAC
jgi:hypothetical protein